MSDLSSAERKTSASYCGRKRDKKKRLRESVEESTQTGEGRKKKERIKCGS